MNLPQRPPQRTIHITSPIPSIYGTPRSGVSIQGSTRSKIDSAHSRRAPSRCEFDPSALRESWMRNAVYRNYYPPESRAPTEYSFVMGKQRMDGMEKRPPKASISIDLPSPVADRLFGRVHPTREDIWSEVMSAHSQWYNYGAPPPSLLHLSPPPRPSTLSSFELGCVFALLSLSTVAVFLLLCYVYLKNFVL